MLTDEEIENVRTRDKELTWQVLEYDKYDECKEGGTAKVYALSPYGSAYVRSQFQTEYERAILDHINGGFKSGSHRAVDWEGRKIIDNIKEQGKSAVDIKGIAGEIYRYEYNRLSAVYGSEKAKQKLQAELEEEMYYLPIVAVAPGRVDSVGYSAREGFYVEVKHSDIEGISTYYMHLKRWPEVNEGDYVGAGTLLGYEGCTGRSFGTHLHFQINGTSESPSSYIFPTFNPFYYKNKAEEAGYDLTSEYMSLYRTVSMVDNGALSVNSDNLNNNHPEIALVDNVSNLIQNQGTITPSKRNFSMSGCFGWNGDCNTADKYISHLKNEYGGRGDFYLYNEEAYFDRKLALSEGYLNVDAELFSTIYGYIPVKTDMSGGLPKITREELDYILDHWLESRYADEELTFLREKVFTEEMIETMLEQQEKYKISVVFMLAVATQECQMGVSSVRDADAFLSDEVNHNIFSIKYPTKRKAINIGSVNYIDDTWSKYESYPMAVEDFALLIAEEGPYFRDSNYTIAEIGARYCEPPYGWINGVTNLSLEIMQYYMGDKWSFPEGVWGIDNSEFLSLAGVCVQWLYNHGFGYSFSGGYIPYKNLNTDGSFGAPRANAIDCSTYVSWVIYEYGRIHGIEELTHFGDHGSYDFQPMAERIAKGIYKNDYDKYFQAVWVGNDGLGAAKSEKDIHAMLQPGDILIYTKGAGHVDIFYDWVNPENENSTSIYKYSCGSAPSSISSYRNGEPYSASMPMERESPTSKKHGFWDVTAVLRLAAGGAS